MTDIGGRERERRIVVDLLTGRTPGQPPLVVVEGRCGSGRTWLLEAVAATARRLDHPVVAGSGPLETAIGRAVEAAAGQRRTLLAWDDPQWTSAGTPLVLDDVTRSVPVLVVLARRTNAPLPGIDTLEPSRVLRLRLGPLPHSTVERMVADLFGAHPSAEVLALAVTAAASPGAVVELATGLREDALAVVERGQVVLTAARLPHRTRRRLVQQLAVLPEPARHLIQVASTIGVAFPLRDLARLMRRGTASLLPAIDELLAAGLLSCTGERLSFGHELVRAAVAGSLPRSVWLALRDELAHLDRAHLDRAYPNRPHFDRAHPDRAHPDRPHSDHASLDRLDLDRARFDGAGDLGRLTERERRIAALVGRALTNDQIATEIGLTAHTVNYHLRRIFRKLGIASRVELATRHRDQAA